MKLLGMVLLILVAIAGGAGWFFWEGTQNRVAYRTAPVTRGEVLATIAATGVVEPEEVIDVGAQVQGKIESLGRDPQDPHKSIDYGSEVNEGTILAQIDDAVFSSQVEQARANLQRSEADLQQWQSKLSEAERDWNRIKGLFAKKVISEADRDLSLATLETAKAQLAVGQAAINQAKASLKQSEISLGYTTIKSPVKGIIVDRRVNVGQTVVASLNAPSLFLIAKDLKKMQVWASVNEADIGQIHRGQKVRFTVDAFPRDRFDGTVSQIRLNANMTQNVVTYTVVVATDNPGGKLLPYLTANVQFFIDSRQDVLTVPNLALRWKPKTAEGEDDKGKKTEENPGAQKKSDPAARGAATAGDAAKGRRRERTGRVWVQEGISVRSIEVRVGLANGTTSEVSGEGLTEGMEVIVGEVRRSEETSSGRSPFAPQGFRGGGGGGRGGRGM